MENKMTGLDFKIREVAGRIRDLREVNGLSIEEMAQRGADYICGHVNAMTFDCDVINVVLSGSVHTKLPSHKYTDRMAELVAERTGRRFGTSEGNL